MGWEPIRPDREPEPPPGPKFGNGGYDRGIEYAVLVLQAYGIETTQSCEGGPGHSYPEPTIDFSGGEAEGWRALSVCLNNGLPVSELRRVWSIEHFVPHGPEWQLVFARRIPWIPEDKRFSTWVNQHGYRIIELIDRPKDDST